MIEKKTAIIEEGAKEQRKRITGRKREDVCDGWPRIVGSEVKYVDNLRAHNNLFTTQGHHILSLREFLPNVKQTHFRVTNLQGPSHLKIIHKNQKPLNKNVRLINTMSNFKLSKSIYARFEAQLMNLLINERIFSERTVNSLTTDSKFTIDILKIMNCGHNPSLEYDRVQKIFNIFNLDDNYKLISCVHKKKMFFRLFNRRTKKFLNSCELELINKKGKKSRYPWIVSIKSISLWKTDYQGTKQSYLLIKVRCSYTSSPVLLAYNIGDRYVWQERQLAQSRFTSNAPPIPLKQGILLATRPKIDDKSISGFTIVNIDFDRLKFIYKQKFDIDDNNGEFSDLENFRCFCIDVAKFEYNGCEYASLMNLKQEYIALLNITRSKWRRLNFKINEEVQQMRPSQFKYFEAIKKNGNIFLVYFETDNYRQKDFIISFQIG